MYLSSIKEQTLKICLEASAEHKQNGWALQFVKEQSPEICKRTNKMVTLRNMYKNRHYNYACGFAVAIKQNGLALQ